MDYTVYKLIHLIGLALVCYSLGGFAMRVEDDAARKRLSMSHGGGLLLALLGGFGMLAKHKISAMEPWVIYKVVVWLALGGAIVIFKRKPDLTRLATLGLAALMVGAAYLGIFH